VSTKGREGEGRVGTGARRRGRGARPVVVRGKRSGSSWERGRTKGIERDEAVASGRWWFVGILDSLLQTSNEFTHRAKVLLWASSRHSQINSQFSSFIFLFSIPSWEVRDIHRINYPS